MSGRPIPDIEALLDRRDRRGGAADRLRIAGACSDRDLFANSPSIANPLRAASPTAFRCC